jgi:hypothetical protein
MSSSLFCCDHEKYRNDREKCTIITTYFIDSIRECGILNKNLDYVALLFDFYIYNKQFVESLTKNFYNIVKNKIEEFSNDKNYGSKFKKHKIMIYDDHDYKYYFTTNGEFMEPCCDNIIIEL